MGTEAAIIVNSLEAIHHLPSTIAILKGDGLGDREVLAIASFRSLKELDLSGCEDVTDRSITELGRLPLLEKLDLSFCNQITDSSLEALALLPAIRFLNLNWCYGVTDDGLRALGRCRPLESLTLWSCEAITDAGISALANLPCLRVLDLPEFARISDRALAELSASAVALECLRLDHLDGISDEGLARLGTLKGLRRLTIQACSGITADAVAALQQALPGCEISFKS